MTAKAQTSYRPDIDGLRSLAVVPVILFHCGLPGFSGGYVGVDVFFVISGFLITSILQRDIEAGRFSIVKFYERRVRRIAPALVTMLVATICIVPIFYLTSDLIDFGRSVIATLAFLSNVYFYLTTDYFATAADLKPLLHTWSLAVEEQFYIVFPLLLAALATWRTRSRFALLAALGAASFAVSVVQTQLDPEGAFFLPFSRGWELLLGSLLALLPAPLRGRLQHDALGWLGVALIVYAVVMFTDETPFPGATALVPCLGALLIIANGTGSSASVLGSWPLRWCGVISYSLYLWHWPLLALYRYQFGLHLSPAATACILLTTFVLAYLSWRFVETPWRVNAYWTRRRIFSATAASAVVLFGVSAGLLFLDRHYERFQRPVARLARAAIDINPLRDKCDRPSLNRVRAGDVCSVGDLSVKSSFAIVGDSIGDALVPGFERAATEMHKRGLVFTNSGCSPLFETQADNPLCPIFYDAVAAKINELPDVHSIIFVGRWATMVEGGRFGEEMTKGRFMVDAETRERSYDENLRVFERALDRIAKRLPGKDIVIVASVPEQAVNPPRFLAMQQLRGEALGHGITREQHERRNKRLHEILERVAARDGYRVVDITKVACNETECPLFDGENVLYADDNHPSRSAATSWSAVLGEALQ